MSSRPIRLLLGAPLAAVLLLVSACGSGEDSGSTDGGISVEATPEPATESPTGSPAGSPTGSANGSASAEPSPSADRPATVRVRFSGDDVEPVGKVVRLSVGERLVLDIRSESAGELHVHSTPEQEIAFPAGRSKAEIVIDRPGVVEVESHDLHKLVLQLEVR